MLCSKIELVKRVGFCVAWVCLVCEMAFFPSLENLYGALLCIFSWWLFSSFFFRHIILRKHLFSWIYYFSAVLYIYVPLVSTLIEGKPVSYLMETPMETFTVELAMFLIQTLAFYVVAYNKLEFSFVKHVICRLRLYSDPSESILWLMGFVGLAALVVLAYEGWVDYGDVFGKFLQPMKSLQFCPLILMFRSFVSSKSSLPKWFLYLYTACLVLISISGNSREGLIYPIATIFILLFVSHLITNEKFNLLALISLKSIVLVVVLLVIALFARNVSSSMLLNRGFRKDVSRTELMRLQLQTLSEKQDVTKREVRSYDEGWDETYVDNFALQRLTNPRITDECLYHVRRIDVGLFGNGEMRDFFYTRLIALLPSPVINFMGLGVDKKDYSYSEGDLLTAVSWGKPVFPSYVVSSKLPVAYATFGVLAVPILLILTTIKLLLIDSFSLIKSNSVFYSFCGLAIVFEIFGMNRNGITCAQDLAYILRGFWQTLLIYWVALNIAKIVRGVILKVAGR